MKTMQRVFSMGTLGAIILAGAIGLVIGHNQPEVQAGNRVGQLEVPGSVNDLPPAPSVTYESALPVALAHVSARQAIDAAEKEFQLTDSQIDPVARAVPVVVSAGVAANSQHMQVWIVTADVMIQLSAPPGITPPQTRSKFCIVIDAATGKYIMAYPAQPAQ